MVWTEGFFCQPVVRWFWEEWRLEVTSLSLFLFYFCNTNLILFCVCFFLFQTSTALSFEIRFRFVFVFVISDEWTIQFGHPFNNWLSRKSLSDVSSVKIPHLRRLMARYQSVKTTPSALSLHWLILKKLSTASQHAKCQYFLSSK